MIKNERIILSSDDFVRHVPLIFISFVPLIFISFVALAATYGNVSAAVQRVLSEFGVL
jgi:hypothetical protein